MNTIQDLAKRNIGFKVLIGQGANIDTTTANGRLIFGIFASLAEFEVELIRERTMAGLAATRAKGKKGGSKIHSMKDKPVNYIKVEVYNLEGNKIYKSDLLICVSVKHRNDLSLRKVYDY